MPETITKDNDFTLTVTRRQKASDSNGYSDISKSSSISRTFNFLSQQITTIVREEVYQSRGSSAGGAASVSVNTLIQNFNDVQSPAEIKYYHGVLIEKDGHPPALDDIFPVNKKQYGLNQ